MKIPRLLNFSFLQIRQVLLELCPVENNRLAKLHVFYELLFFLSEEKKVIVWRRISYLLLELIRMENVVRRARSREHGSSVISNLMGSHYSELVRLEMGIIMVCEWLLLLSLNR